MNNEEKLKLLEDEYAWETNSRLELLKEALPANAARHWNVAYHMLSICKKYEIPYHHFDHLSKILDDPRPIVDALADWVSEQRGLPLTVLLQDLDETDETD